MLLSMLFIYYVKKFKKYYFMLVCVFHFNIGEKAHNLHRDIHVIFYFDCSRLSKI